MTRQDILAIAKPILFNTEMVRAVLDNRKTVTRRVVKQNTNSILSSGCRNNLPDVPDSQIIEKLCLPRYKVGDYLYVRETSMLQSMKNFGKKVKMIFAADDALVEFDVSDKEYERLSKWTYFNKWLSPYWVTKETARLFLRVTDVRVERLQDITFEQIEKEGVAPYSFVSQVNREITKKQGLKINIMRIWNSTIKKQDLDRYGWSANPWVWVIEFERVETDG